MHPAPPSAGFNPHKGGKALKLIVPLPTRLNIPGTRAYLVGGSVRDLILGDRPLDYDVVVQAPEAYAVQLAGKLGRRCIPMGRDPFRVYRIVADGIQVDVAAINGDTLEADLMKRDFTINALACDLNDGQVVDPAGGLIDLQQRVVRMVSPRVFRADPLRLLRAFRMAAVLGFAIEPATLAAIRSAPDDIRASAGERILSELHKILACRHSHRTILAMAEAGLLEAVLPELTPLHGTRQNHHHSLDGWDHTFQAYTQLEHILTDPQERLPERASEFVLKIDCHESVLLKLALLLHDIGKPACRSIDGSGSIHFYGHPRRGAAMMPSLCQRLRMSTRDRNRLTFLIANHQRPMDLYLAATERSGQKSTKAQGRFFRLCAESAPHILLHALADNLGKHPIQEQTITGASAFIIDLLETYFNRIKERREKPLINGRDLIEQFGLTPSPQFATLLSHIEEAHLSGDIQNRPQALQWVATHLKQTRSLPVVRPENTGSRMNNSNSDNN